MFQRAEVQKYVAKFGSGGINFGIVVVEDGVPLEGAMQGQSKNGEGNGSYYKYTTLCSKNHCANVSVKCWASDHLIGKILFGTPCMCQK